MGKKKIRRRRANGAGRAWEVASFVLPESVDRAGLAAMIVIAEPGSGVILAQELVPRPAQQGEIREFVEEVFRKTILGKRPRRIVAIGEAVFESLEGSTILTGAEVVFVENSPLIAVLQESMEDYGMVISEGTLIGAAHHAIEIAREARRLARVEPWVGLHDNEWLRLEGEGLTHPVVSIMGAAGEVFGASFFTSQEAGETFSKAGRALQLGLAHAEDLHEISMLALWLEPEESVGDLAAAAAERQGLSAGPGLYPRLLWLRPGRESPEIFDVEGALDALRHLEALAATLEAVVETHDGLPAFEDWTASAALSDGSEVSIQPLGSSTRKSIPEEPTKILRIRISVDAIEPEIWRLVDVPDNFTLAQMHAVIQQALGWDFAHLWEFSRGKTRYSPDSSPYGGGTPVEDAFETTLLDVLGERARKFHYLYDFGDNWEVTLNVTKRLDPEEVEYVPRMIDGERAGPPEDIGGVGGYYALVENLDEAEWSFDPEHFDLNEYSYWAEDPNDPTTIELDVPTVPKEPTLARVLNRLRMNLLDLIAEFWGVDTVALTRRSEREEALYKVMTTPGELEEIVEEALPQGARQLLMRLLVEEESVPLFELLEEASCANLADAADFVEFGELGVLCKTGLVFIGVRREGGEEVYRVTVPLDLREPLRKVISEGFTRESPSPP